MLIGVDRIDHGYHVSWTTKGSVIVEVRRRQICLAFCTTSNPS